MTLRTATMSTIEKKWKDVLTDIELEISRPNFNTWFKKTFAVKQEHGIFYLGVPNEFNREWLYTKFHDMILEKLKDIDGISFLVDPNPDYQSNHWLTCIIIDPSITGFTREDLRLKMEEANIETRPLWKPMHLQPVFKDCPYYGDNVSEDLFDKGLCLPSSPVLSQEDLERVIDVIRKLSIKHKIGRASCRERVYSNV